MIARNSVAVLCLTMFSLSAAAASAPQSSSDDDSSESKDLAEIDRQLNNPLTTIWSLTFEDSLLVKKGDAISGTTLANTLFFQPGLPVPVGKNDEMVIIARPVLPLVTNPVLDPESSDGVRDHDTGLGDIQMLSLLGPNRKDGIVWGAGGTFKFPTATEDTLGADKYQAGPAGMLIKMGKPWVVGTLVQHWWSYAGDDDSPHTNQTDIQYFLRYALPDAWSIGMGPTITADWKADSDNRWTVPVGLGLTKTMRWGKMPVKLRAEAHYSVVRPDDFGNEWKFVFRIAPVIPSPFR